jgi:hypothetical protein
MEPALNINGLIDFAIQVPQRLYCAFLTFRKANQPDTRVYLASSYSLFVDLKTRLSLTVELV